jgi:hypothetical protein
MSHLHTNAYRQGREEKSGNMMVMDNTPHHALKKTGLAGARTM